MRLLQGLIQINTYNNPDRGHPGNELALVRWVRDYLTARGIEHVKVYETSPGRGCLVARLKGNGAEKPFLMMAHIDTVDVEPDKWDVDPLSGTIRDGYLWGRGAIDDKGMAASEIEAMVRIHRERIPLKRDVILLLTADEEGGGEHGVKYMVEHHFDEIRAAAAINEGGNMMLRDGKVEFVAIQCTEKTMHNATMIATGTSGHSSRPHDDSAIDKLARALTRLADFKAPIQLNDVTTGFFKGQSQLAKDREMAAHFRKLVEGDPSSAEFVARTPHFNAQLRSTAVATMLNAGIRFNVIPSEARATLNIRMLPGQDLDKFIAALLEHLGHPDDVRIVPEVPRAKREREPGPSPTTHPLYRAIRNVARDLHPDAIVLPTMSTGATDSRDLRLHGIPSYGILPFALPPEDLRRIHGDNERIPVKALPGGVDFIYRLVLEFARR